MEDFQVILYIIVGVIYLITRFFKKATAQPPVPGEAAPPKKDEAPSLEDMMKEIRDTARRAKKAADERKAERMQQKPPQRQPLEGKGAKKVNPPAVPNRNTQPTEKVPSYETLENASASYDQIPSADQMAAELEATPTYANEAANVDYEDPKKAGYAGLDDHKKRFAQFDPQQRKVNAYGSLLRNMDGAKQAFILGEIFRRKY